MKTGTFLKRVAAGMGTAALAIAMTACASHNATAGNDYGQVRTEAAAQQQPLPPDQVVATVPAPENAQGVAAPATPAVIPGPAKVDDTGRAYTSSSVGSSGNASSTGTNTNVNIIPKKSTSTVTVTETPAAPVETPVAVVETPAPVVTPVTEPAPMTSSTTVETPAPATTQETTTTTKTHRRMRKD
jgi:hypothetical protein